jgi:3-oxoadipate enol-lactonase
VSYVEANGIRIHFQRTWAGNRDGAPPPVIVFVHGLAIDSLASFYLWFAAPSAAAGMDAIYYDQRGHGRTEVPASRYRLDDFVDDLDGLLAALDVDVPVHLVGGSFGGTIAFSYASRHPERVASVVSLDTGPATELWAKHTRAALNALVDDAAPIIAAIGVDGMIAHLRKTEGLRASRMFRSAHRVMAYTTVLEDAFTGPLLDHDAIRSIRCPVLSVVGSEGFHKDDPTMLSRALPNCRTEIVEGGDHFLLTSMPSTVRNLVLNWVHEQHLVLA